MKARIPRWLDRLTNAGAGPLRPRTGGANPLLGALLIAMLGACSSMSVNSTYDHSVSFADLKTYNWMAGQEVGTGDPRVDDLLLDSSIREAVERELSAKGYRKQPSGEPDFLLGYHAAIKKKLDVIGMRKQDRYSGYYGYDVSWPRDDELRAEFDEGSLIIDVVDPRTQRLIWRGSALAVVQLSPDSPQTGKRVDEAVQKMLERFPPN